MKMQKKEAARLLFLVSFYPNALGKYVDKHLKYEV